MLPLSPHCPWWFWSYKNPKMVDLSNVEAWWQDTSLFNDEPIDSINIDDYISNEKANAKGDQTALGLPSNLEWFDEKVDLSVLENLNGLLDHQNETEMLMEDASTYLLGLLGDSFNPSQFSTDIFKNEEIDFSKEFDVPELVADSASSEILDSHLASPRCNTLQVDSPAFNPIQSPASPYSDITDVPEESSSSALQSPESIYIPSDLVCDSLDSSPFQVTVCDNVASPSSSESVLSLEEVSRSVRKRKYVNDGKSTPKIVKVMLPEDIPVCRKSKTKDRREKKKVQNKEAAARYRIKKRMEEKIRSDEIENLELHQKELQKKHDELQTEIKYLKSLMCEILIKKGVMK